MALAQTDIEADLDALSRLLRGEADGFDLIYERHRARLYSFLLRLTRRPALAEELSQEAWLRFATRARTLPPTTALRPFLLTVARNLFVSHRRRALLDPGCWFTEGWALGGCEGPPLLEALQAREELQAMETALGLLSVGDREALLLCGVEGLSPADAAQVTGLRPDAFRQRLSRARARLATHLNALQTQPSLPETSR